MKTDDFKDFSGTAKLLNYKFGTFYSSGLSVQLIQTFYVIYYKRSYDSYEPTNCANIKFHETPRNCLKTVARPSSSLSVFHIKPKSQKCTSEAPETKNRASKLHYHSRRSGRRNIIFYVIY